MANQMDFTIVGHVDLDDSYSVTDALSELDRIVQELSGFGEAAATVQVPEHEIVLP